MDVDAADWDRRDNYARIYDVVRQIPRGKIASYGQVADLAGLHGHARQVGYALHATPDEVDIPWQRVLNAKGEISPRSDPMMEGVQQSMLEAEGIEFDLNGRIPLSLYRWEPQLHLVAAKPTARKKAKKAKKTSRRKARKKKRPAAKTLSSKR